MEEDGGKARGGNQIKIHDSSAFSFDDFRAVHKFTYLIKCHKQMIFPLGSVFLITLHKASSPSLRARPDNVPLTFRKAAGAYFQGF